MKTMNVLTIACAVLILAAVAIVPQKAMADYETTWFDAAIAEWNDAHPPGEDYNFDWWEYTFPQGADHTEGDPPDDPILPMDWMDITGLGLSRKIDLAGSGSSLYTYTTATVQAWKAKGFRGGRFHLDPFTILDLNADPDGTVFKTQSMEDLVATLQLFVNEDIPSLVALSNGGYDADPDVSYADTENYRDLNFSRITEWWRQIAEACKDLSHLVAFETFIEYHGFTEEDAFIQWLDNGENRYPGWTDYQDETPDNYVYLPGMNNLQNEISKIVRETNPTRLVCYRPIGQGRTRLIEPTPWRYDTEGDPLDIQGKGQPYWLISGGGSANVKTDYMKGVRTNDPDLIDAAKWNTWGPYVDYYNGTGNPTWLALWGLRVAELADLDPPITDDELVDYLHWLQDGLQNDPTGDVKIGSGFQQAWWLWDYATGSWFTTPQGNWDDTPYIREELSDRTWQPTVDTTPPAAPTGLDATAGDGEVSLDWNDNTESDLDGYNVYRSTTTGSGFSKINGSLVSASAYTDSTVTNGTTYYYVATAVDTNTNESGYSNEDSAMPDAGGTPEATLTDDTYVYMNSPDLNYGSETTLRIKGSNGTFIRDDYLKFTVTGVSGGVNSATLKVYSNDVVGAVMAKTVADTSWTEGTVTWTNRPAMGTTLDTQTCSSSSWIEFDVTSHITGNGTFSLGLTSTEVGNTTFSSKEGANSPELVVETGSSPPDTTAPANPTGLAATAGNEEVSLDWNDNTEGDLDGYNVYRSTTTGSGYSKINGSLVSASAYTDSSVSNDTTYYYVVTAVDTSTNESGYSNEDSAVPASNDIYVYDIAMGGYESKTNYYCATATVWIKDSPGGNDIEGATVYGSWSGATKKGDDEMDTGSNGKATLTSDDVKGGGTFTFTVTDVTATGYTYNSSLNNEDYDSITLP